MKKFILAIFFGLPLSAQSTTYYVSPTGNDSNSGTIGQPWQHVCYATGGGGTIGNDGAGGGGTACSTSNANALIAGDTVYLMAGTYTEYNIQFRNSGTNGSPITLTPYNGESVIIDGGWVYQGCGTGCPYTPVFYIDGRDYITLDGGASRSLTITRGESMNIMISYNTQSTNITIKNSSITNFTYGDNSGHIYLNSQADNIVIKNNSLHDCQGCPQPISGSSSLIMFGVYSVDIENNEIYSQPANPIHTGINFKHEFYTGYSKTVKNNLIHDLSSNDYSDTCIISNADNTLFSNNVCYNITGYQVQLYISEASCSFLNPYSNTFIHNTFAGSAHYGVQFDENTGCQVDHDNIFRNNIIQTNSASSLAGFSFEPYGTDAPNNITQEYNDIYSSGQSNMVLVNGKGYTASCSGCYTGFLGNFSKSIQQPPVFVNAPGGNFALASNSPGHNAASDGTDMGAQICAVGVNASCSSTSAAAPPAAPRGFTLR